MQIKDKSDLRKKEMKGSLFEEEEEPTVYPSDFEI